MSTDIDSNIDVDNISQTMLPIVEEQVLESNDFTFYVKKSSPLSKKTKKSINKSYVIYSDDINTMEDIKNLNTEDLNKYHTTVDPKDLEQHLKDLATGDLSDPRTDQVYLAALAYSTQSALYSRKTEINKFIKENEGHFSTSFNFQPLMLAGGRVSPPVILEAKDLFLLEDSLSSREVKKSYEIIQQAAVISLPITWRTYLNFDAAKPILPSKLLIPATEAELWAWKRGVTKGWETGLKQANYIYLENINKLQSDYIGMVRFHLMLEQKLVSNPVTNKLALGVTGNDELLNIGETIFEIAKLPKFNKKAETWRALPRMKPFIDFKTE
jgi:defect-in-organelle-trafficking protein DotC